jgi:hypothetical protein
MKKTLFITTALIFSFLATIAFADTKIYPGSMCVRWNSSQPVPILDFSSINNPSITAWLYVDCPYINNGLKTSSAWVKVIDQNSNLNVRCSQNNVYLKYDSYTLKTSWWGWWGAPKSSSGAKYAVQHLSWGVLGNNKLSHGYLSCSIPPVFSGKRSAIVSYSVTN